MALFARRRGRAGLQTLLALAVCLAPGCSKPADDVAAPPVSVVVGVPIRKEIVEWDEYVGRLDAVEFVEVRSRVSGYLTSIHFNEGQLVKKGDLLFVIDPRPFQAEVRRAEADVAQAKAKIAETQAMQFQAEANKRAAQSRQNLAQRQLKRLDTLLPTRAVSQDDYDIQASTLAQAQAQVEASSAAIESAKAAIITAESGVSTAEAAVAIAKLNLDYTHVYAPVSGRMSKHVVTEGNLISGGAEQSTLLSTIVSIDPIHCYFDADEQAFLKYTRLAKAGTRASSRDVKNPVYVSLADEPKGFPHAGHMDFVDNRMDPETGTMRGRAILANPDLTMVPGLFVRLRLPGSGRYRATLIPDFAIGLDQSEKFVFVVESDNTVRRQAIEAGPVVHGLRVVRRGLAGTERIVLRGLQRVRPGAKVVAKQESIAVRDDEGLPDNYEPVPRERWLNRAYLRSPGGGRPSTSRDAAPPSPERTSAPPAGKPSESDPQ